MFLTHLGMWGCAFGPPEASAQMAKSPGKEERKKKKEANQYIHFEMYIKVRKLLKAKEQGL